MSWIQEHKHAWRAAILVLLLVALLGPWWFDLIVVPAQYACTFRLEGDFCGVPAPGTWFLFAVISMPFSFVAGLISGTTGLADLSGSFRGILVGLVIYALVLPFFNILFLFRHGESQRLRVCNIVVWGLAVGAGLWFGFSSHPELFWVLWGVWLYIGLAASALILELITPVKKRSGEGI